MRYLIPGILPRASLSPLLKKTASLLQKPRPIEKLSLSILYQEKLPGWSRMGLSNSSRNTSGIKPDSPVTRMFHSPYTAFKPALRTAPPLFKAFVVFNNFSEDGDKKIHILIANDLTLSCKKTAGVYMQRWGIERTFQKLKNTFCFGRCQVRHKEKIMRYWMLPCIQPHLLD